MFNPDELSVLGRQIAGLASSFDALPAYRENNNLAQIETVLQALSAKMADNYPYFHPFYLGQMLKPPHPIARLAYSLCLYINPNNHALDGGRATSALEKEAVADIARMFGWLDHLGHLTSGGTFANLEALWVAKNIAPGKSVAASELAHYTHERISRVLDIKFDKIPCDARGRMDVAALETRLREGEIGTVVVTLGTTLAGTLDPLDAILALRKTYDFRIHIDAAYGGYFSLCKMVTADSRRAMASIVQADSIVVDPHKHGLQPYGCGCVLFRDPAVGSYYKHDSPYTYFSSDELHLGEISLECSRPGAAAGALWATQKLLPLTPDGEFAAALQCSRDAAMSLFQWLALDKDCVTVLEPTLDIVLWLMASDSAKKSSALAQTVFDNAAALNLHLALARVPKKLLADKIAPDSAFWDDDDVVCLRVCLMKPAHKTWLPTIQQHLRAAMTAAHADIQTRQPAEVGQDGER
ncbi:pyridoxal phosphate-dependent decarboxylase family protein [Serratia rubidaea]|uniref:Aspartate aminotransferase family protein n=1 Tax=Serratia rubidaea TaxID=61652 RepID=A0A448SRX1_SERRU|nr:aminotransferase class V-fold PLP-dependent enzyme [Serratia rubidaea]MBH1932540.1 aspartate aminotransferase family protein [Serratia rubidaea]MDC6119163.1 aminotransferase class V-fold PLP-dependent enzyme [Serratia rubidaea]MEB7584953.1 aminotransferase class V-fold PLP-dependent enzyme [Serratia rubidaea]VEI70442.1 L-2,4-diaminobutyrate decarboxylase [Serratia rubidaea]